MKTASYFTYTGPGRIGISVGAPRGYPHLSYSIAPAYSVGAFVTHDPGRKLNQLTPVVSAQPYRAGDRAPH